MPSDPAIETNANDAAGLVLDDSYDISKDPSLKLSNQKVAEGMFTCSTIKSNANHNISLIFCLIVCNKPQNNFIHIFIQIFFVSYIKNKLTIYVVKLQILNLLFFSFFFIL